MTRTDLAKLAFRLLGAFLFVKGLSSLSNALGFAFVGRFDDVGVAAGAVTVFFLFGCAYLVGAGRLARPGEPTALALSEEAGAVRLRIITRSTPGRSRG